MTDPRIDAIREAAEAYKQAERSVTRGSDGPAFQTYEEIAAFFFDFFGERLEQVEASEARLREATELADRAIMDLFAEMMDPLTGVVTGCTPNDVGRLAVEALREAGLVVLRGGES